MSRLIKELTIKICPEKRQIEISSYPTPSAVASDCFAERRDPRVAVQKT